MTMTTTERVLEMRERDPGRRAVEMAAEIGVSQQRIRQILVKQGLPTSFFHPSCCMDCGTLVRHNSTKRCRSCKRAFIRVTLPCGWCDKPVTRLRSQLKHSKSGFIFCDRPHRTKWLFRHGNEPARIGILKYNERVRRGLALLEAQEAVDTEPGN